MYCMYVCMYVSMYVCMCACARTCVCVCVSAAGLSHKPNVHYFLAHGGKWWYIEIIPLFNFGPWF